MASGFFLEATFDTEVLGVAVAVEAAVGAGNGGGARGAGGATGAGAIIVGAEGIHIIKTPLLRAPAGHFPQEFYYRNLAY